MKTTRNTQKATGDDISLPDGKYTGRCFWAGEKDGKASLGFIITTGAGEAKRWGRWGTDYGWVQDMFGAAFGEHENLDISKVAPGTTFEVVLKTKGDYGQEVARFSPTGDTAPAQGEADDADDGDMWL